MEAKKNIDAEIAVVEPIVQPQDLFPPITDAHAQPQGLFPQIANAHGNQPSAYMGVDDSG